MPTAQPWEFQFSKMLANHKIFIQVQKAPGFINRVMGLMILSISIDGKEQMRRVVKRGEKWDAEVLLEHKQVPDMADSFVREMEGLLKLFPIDFGSKSEVVPVKPFQPKDYPLPADMKPVQEIKIEKKPEAKEAPKLVIIRKGDCVRCGTKGKELKAMPCIVYGRMFKSHLPKK